MLGGASLGQGRGLQATGVETTCSQFYCIVIYYSNYHRYFIMFLSAATV